MTADPETARKERERREEEEDRKRREEEAVRLQQITALMIIGGP